MRAKKWIACELNDEKENKTTRRKKNHRIGIKINEWTNIFLIFVFFFYYLILRCKGSFRWFCAFKCVYCDPLECIVIHCFVTMNGIFCVFVSATRHSDSSSAYIVFTMLNVSISWNWQISLMLRMGPCVNHVTVNRIATTCSSQLGCATDSNVCVHVSVCARVCVLWAHRLNKCTKMKSNEQIK